MTKPTHHPGGALLREYADGTLPEAPALVVATHLAFCSECRARVADLEAESGAILEDEAPDPVSADCLKAVLARLDDPMPLPPPMMTAPLPVRTDGVIRVPEPLRSYLGAPVEALPWRALTGTIDEFDLGVGRQPVRTRLMRMKAETAAPRHSHRGVELIVVLAGGFSDQRGSFGRGDVVLDDASLDHAPVAHAGEDCYCLIVTDAPLRLTGGLGRILNPFLRF